ncbi:MAG TPA: GTPase ObgE, partial [Candidatus Hydrogenedentes bacterium]|nr:GTPase ObgE [Candidatus Hydrogenedentota bacterium]
MFVDRVRIRVTGGAGGNGCCSFRREKYVPRGGPDGGDGGHGGDVFFVAVTEASSLIKLRYHAHWKGEAGTHGQGSNRHGKTGAETAIPVPVGTLVRDFDTGEIRCDLAAPGQRFRAAQGGRGGKGNARFTSSTRRVPRFAELGEPGEEANYVLELKLIAEVGLVGLPNAGKSTFLSRVTAATPKIADYPFTTITPNLGVAELDGFRSLTMA